MEAKTLSILEKVKNGEITTQIAQEQLCDLFGIGFRNLDELKASITNGRLRIESNNENGSIKLDKWINQNKNNLSEWLDIEIYAH